MNGNLDHLRKYLSEYSSFSLAWSMLKVAIESFKNLKTDNSELEEMAKSLAADLEHVLEKYKNKYTVENMIARLKYREYAKEIKKLIEDTAELIRKSETPERLIQQYTDEINNWKDPTNKNKLANLYHERGRVYFKKCEYDKAIEDYNKVIELIPIDAMAYNDRGKVYYENGNYEQALKDFTKAIELYHRCDTAYYNRGVVYAEIGEYDKAIEDYKKAIKFATKLPSIPEYSMYGIAEVYFMQGKLDEALSQLNQAMDMLTNYLNLKILFIPIKYSTKISERIKRSLYYSKSYWLKILIYQEKNDIKNVEKTFIEAKENLRKVIDKKLYKDGPSYASFAEIYCEANKDIDEAFDLIQKAMEIRPDYYSYYVLGYYYFRKGDIQKAIEHLEKSKSLNPSNTWCLYRLGCFYKTLGEIGKAKEVWYQGLKINPKHRFIKKELEKLELVSR